MLEMIFLKVKFIKYRLMRVFSSDQWVATNPKRFSSKISNKLKNCQLDLSSIAGQVSKPLILLEVWALKDFRYY